MRKLISLIFCLIWCLRSGAADVSRDSVIISANFEQTLSSGEHSPFWLAANKHGLSSVDRGFGYVEVGAFKQRDPSKRFSWAAGIDIAIPWKFTSDFVIQQLYGELRYRSLSLSVGSRYYESELCDPDLSSGSLIFSGNARPIPQVRVGIPEFQPFHFLKDFLWIKGYLAYGMFTDSKWQEHWAASGTQYTKNVLYCSRGFWLKAGDSRQFPLEFTAGIDLATQFGGTIYNYELVGLDKTVNVKMPTDFEAWVRAFIPLDGRSTTIMSEATNVEGNTLGAYDFALSWTSDADWKIKAYWQHMFEDHSQMWIQFPWKDGLWGVQAWLPKNPVVSSAVFEFLYSKYQSGPVYNDSEDRIPEQVSGVDRYYNHYLYNGWMHWGMGIGNPFSISPVYNADHRLTFTATRNISYHFGMTGSPLESLDYRILVSNTRSWGDYWTPFPDVRSMWNFLAEVKWRPDFMKNFEWRFALACDRGDLVGNSFGGMIGIRYDLPVRWKK